jgi:2-polyprenyl-3-methyl-5-hydroxy-6-metoxy-1,4-benzoquinol methylase
MKRVCPICSSAENRHIYSQKFHNRVIALTDKYDVVACKRCGFSFADNIPAQAEFNNYYAVMSKFEFNYREGVVSADYVDYYNKITAFLKPYIEYPDANILDIGCSTGGLLTVFKKQGYSNLDGIDPSPSGVKAANELYCIKATADNISSFDPKEKFDLIMLSAVLEHLVDFEDFMNKIWSMLNDKGLLFIEVPDVERFDLHISAPFQQFSIEHVNYFSNRSVRNLLSKYSFDIVDIVQSENRINMVTEPDLFVLAVKTERAGSEHVRDDISEARLGNYIAQCHEIERDIKALIHEKLSGRDKVIVMGVGTHTQRLLGSGLDVSKILYFVDSNARYIGKKLKGIEIKSPADIKEENPILISTYAYQQEIAIR